MSKTLVKAYAAVAADKPLEPYEYELPELGPEQVDIQVAYCGICHSDFSMIRNEWGFTRYPFVPGHEVIGTVIAAGELAKGLKIGDQVGLGWFAGSCMHCLHCLSGEHNLCRKNEYTIVGRNGGFADKVRCHWAWATPIPAAVDSSKAGPLLCGGITVFHPLMELNVRPTHRVGVIGVGGLGHLALQFLNKWGCEVTAFTTSPDKTAEAMAMGAHAVVNSKDKNSMAAIAGTLDMVLNTTDANLRWSDYMKALAPKGILHTVGMVPEPIPVNAGAMINSQLSVSGSPLGSPAATREMIEFCARHKIEPITEQFDLCDVNAALEHFAAGKARYRLVLKM
jgi:uncharacterized zinc-type alcohol dehydrogenase-like protein